MIRESVLALVLLTSIVSGQTYKQTNQYQIALPDGWTQISGETVGFLTQELHHSAPDRCIDHRQIPGPEKIRARLLTVRSGMK
jgi:hypothetical protein